jgi:hypothetical protein
VGLFSLPRGNFPDIKNSFKSLAGGTNLSLAVTGCWDAESSRISWKRQQ